MSTLVASDYHPWIVFAALDAAEHVHSCRAKMHLLGSRLTVGKLKQFGGKIYVLPAQGYDFAKTTAGE